MPADLRANAEEVFKSFDVDNSGTLDIDELVKCFDLLQLKLDANGLREYAKQEMRKADTSFDYQLDQVEFLRMYAKIMVQTARSGFSFSDWKKKKNQKKQANAYV